MLRIPVNRVLQKAVRHGVTSTTGTRSFASAPEKVEVFIDDKRVLVDPGTTVLQVN